MVGEGRDCDASLDAAIAPAVPDLHYSHVVLGKGAGFVSADDVGRSHRLAAGQLFDQVLLLQHLLHRKGKREGDGEGESFGHCHHDERDCEHEVAQQVSDVLVGVEAVGDDVGGEQPNGQDHKEDDSRDEAEPSDFLGEVLKFFLEGRALVHFFLDEFVELALPVVLSREQAEHESFAAHDLRPADDDGGRRLLVVEAVVDAFLESVLVELVRLAGHRALIDDQVVGPESQPVDWDFQA